MTNMAGNPQSNEVKTTISSFKWGVIAYLLLYCLVMIKNAILTGHWVAVINDDFIDSIMFIVNLPGTVVSAIPVILFFGVHSYPYLFMLVISVSANSLFYGFVFRFSNWLFRKMRKSPSHVD
jgi:hypothetical protein